VLFDGKQMLNRHVVDSVCSSIQSELNTAVMQQVLSVCHWNPSHQTDFGLFIDHCFSLYCFVIVWFWTACGVMVNSLTFHTFWVHVEHLRIFFVCPDSDRTSEY